MMSVEHGDSPRAIINLRKPEQSIVPRVDLAATSSWRRHGRPHRRELIASEQVTHPTDTLGSPNRCRTETIFRTQPTRVGYQADSLPYSAIGTRCARSRYVDGPRPGRGAHYRRYLKLAFGRLRCSRRAWRPPAADPDGARDRDHLLAVTARAHTGHHEEVAELACWGRQHDDLASFTTVIDAPIGGPNAKVRNRWDHLRTTITNVLTEDRERTKAPTVCKDQGEPTAVTADWSADRRHRYGATSLSEGQE